MWTQPAETSPPQPQSSPDALELPQLPQEPAPPGGGPAPGPPRGRLGVRRMLAVATIAALVGAGSALAVARVTGWGAHTTVTQYIGSGGITPTMTGVQSVLSRVLPSVVSVSATSTRSSPFFPGYGSKVTSSGTGVIISRGGEVITNDHVVSGADSVSVTLSGTSKSFPATVIGELPNSDLALLKVTGQHDFTPADLGDSTTSSVGDPVLAVGFALGLAGGPTVTEGIISATGRQVTTQTASGSAVTLTGMLQTDAAISSGNSGGPLVNASAQVIGINTAVAASSASATAQNIGFAIPSSTVAQLLAQLRGGGGST